MKLLVLSNGEEVIITTPDKKVSLKEDWPDRDFENDYSEAIYEGAFSIINGRLRVGHYTNMKIVKP